MHQKEQASSLMVEEWILKEKHWNVANGIVRTCVVIDGRIRKFCQRKIQISHLDNTCSTCLVIFYLYKEEYIKKKIAYLNVKVKLCFDWDSHTVKWNVYERYTSTSIFLCCIIFLYICTEVLNSLRWSTWSTQ